MRLWSPALVLRFVGNQKLSRNPSVIRLKFVVDGSDSGTIARSGAQ